MEKQAKQLEEKIAEQLMQQFDRLIKKLQARKIDPVGLGLYARAYEYEHYKRVEEH